MHMSQAVRITAFYHFFPMNEKEVDQLREKLDNSGSDLGLHGLVLVAPEGVNGTVAGDPTAIEAFKDCIRSVAPSAEFKDSGADIQPFKRWFVKVRKEIVGLGKTEIVPKGKHNHISIEEWNRMMEEEDVVVLDTRNDYEVAIGKFKGAIDPNLKSFHEFPEFVSKCDIPKNKKVLMYCTGGIRCEKALIEMEKQGYEHVYQLDGGILKYLEESPYKHYEGECFVFDHRTAVNQDLKPSEVYALCPHTGDPAAHAIECKQCGKEGKISDPCLLRDDLHTCSKNCAEMYRRASQKRSKAEK